MTEHEARKIASEIIEQEFPFADDLEDAITAALLTAANGKEQDIETRMDTQADANGVATAPTNETAPRCGVKAGGLTCDRERGHAGDHRGYVEEHDDVLFWRQR